MNRIKDYSAFAIWFAGLGYIALWPITSPDSGGKPFGASLFCGDASLGMLDFLCRSALPLQLPANLHVLGLLSALFVILQLALRALKRPRRPAGTSAVDISALVTRLPVPPPRRKPVRPLPRIKPRTHFGLRGMSR